MKATGPARERDGEAVPDPAARPDRVGWALAIFAVALVVRGLEVLELSDSVLAALIMGDATNYDAWAREIAAGDWLGHEVFYQAPLYPYLLGAIHALAGDELIVVRGVQIVLGSASCAFLALAGWRFFSKPAGVTAGLLLAVYAPVVFADATIQKSVLDIFLVTLSLWVLAGIVDRPSTRRSAGLGLAIGALILSRENALVFPVVLAPWLALRPGRSNAQRLGWAGFFLAGMAAVLLPVAVRNLVVGGEFHLTTSQFGHNFFIGNNEAADGTYAPLIPGRGDPRIERQDAIDIAEKALGRPLSPAEVSGYYTDLALDYIRREPGDWLALIARKAMLTLNAVEFVDTKDQYSHAEESRVLRLAGVFHFGVLAPLALLGVFITWSRRTRLVPLYLLFLAYASTLLLFYVFARYRLPLVPFLVLFAAGGAAGLRPFLRTASRSTIGAAAALALIAAAVCNWPIVDRSYMRSVTHYNVGNELAALGRIDEAIEHYEKAVRLHAGNARANHNLGAIHASRGELARARGYLERALEISPDYVQAHLNLARVLQEQGDPAAAIVHYEAALRLDPTLADAREGLERERARVEP